MKHLIYILLSLVLITSCNDPFDDQNISGFASTDGVGIYPTWDNISFPYSGSIEHCSIHSYYAQWQFENIPDWLQISSTNGESGEHEISIETTENKNAFPRFARVYLRGFINTWEKYDTLNIVQLGYNNEYSNEPFIIKPEADTNCIYINSNYNIEAFLYDEHFLKTEGPGNQIDWCTAKVTGSDQAGFTHKITLTSDDYYETPGLDYNLAYLAIGDNNLNWDDWRVKQNYSIPVIKEAPTLTHYASDFTCNYKKSTYSFNAYANFTIHATCDDEWLKVSSTREYANSNYYTISIDIDEYATTGTEERVADINLCYFRKDTGTYITVGTIECTQTPPSQN